MFYKHWKKVSLALTAFFWASCSNTTVTEPPMYGVPPDISSSSVTPESSAAEPSSSETTQNLSLSSEAQSSSSDFTQVMPAYGVPQMNCDVVAEHDSTVTCANGTTCTEKIVTYMNPDYVGHPCLEPPKDNDSIIQVCPDYGVIYYHDKTFECNNGFTYDERHFNKHYNSSSSTAESSSSAEVTCSPNLDLNKFFTKSRIDRYSTDRAQSDASDQAKSDASRRITTIRDSLSEKAPQCLKDMQEALERNFVAVYGAPYSNTYPAEETCSDGTTRPTKEYLEQQAFDEEQQKKKPQYDEAYAKTYEKTSKNLNERIDKCLEAVNNEP